MSDARVLAAMLRNWRDEVEGAATYRELAAVEDDPHRQSILIKLAEAEEHHADLWEGHLRAVGATVPSRHDVLSKLAAERRTMTSSEWLKRLEADEQQDVGKYQDLLAWLPTGELRQSVAQMAKEEAGHAESLSALVGAQGPASALGRLLGRERWHVTRSSGWVGDAIYGANDGLGAIFGIVSGVAGYTGGSGHFVVISG